MYHADGRHSGFETAEKMAKTPKVDPPQMILPRLPDDALPPVTRMT